MPMSLIRISKAAAAIGTVLLAPPDARAQEPAADRGVNAATEVESGAAGTGPTVPVPVGTPDAGMADAVPNPDPGPTAQPDPPATVSDEGGTESADDDGDANPSPWIRRHLPRDNMWEVGLYGGVLFPSENHELFVTDIDRPSQGQLPFAVAAAEIGIRGSWLPIRHFGIEVEGGVSPTRTRGNGNPRATLWNARGHVIGQVGLWRVVPFALAGIGAIGVSSGDDAVGNDTDLGVHIGLGVKVHVIRNLLVRLDVRDTISYTCDACGLDSGEFTNASSFNAHFPAILLGVSAALGGKKEPPKEEPEEPEKAPDPDRDGDGIIDSRDSCVEEPETFNAFQDTDGCPESDLDADGFWDRPNYDACPEEPGIEPDGCPIGDTDGDGFMDPDDMCVKLPETQNGFEDDDGCPDTLPDDVQSFTGVIRGIEFPPDGTTIRARSQKALDAVVAVLQKYPSLRILIVGHTDTSGHRLYNVRLSLARAQAVKDYLVSKGIAASRLETQGVGPDEPIDTNRTKEGRSLNRRIEFEVLR